MKVEKVVLEDFTKLLNLIFEKVKIILKDVLEDFTKLLNWIFENIESWKSWFRRFYKIVKLDFWKS